MDERSRELLRDLARLADDLGPALVPAGHLELLRSITEAAKHLFGAAACSLALLSDDQTELIFYVASGAGAEDVEGMRMPSSQGIAGWVVTSGQAIAIEDVRQDPRFASSVAKSTGYVPTSILAMPLETDRRMIGVVSVLDRRTEGGEGGRDMELLALFATQAALAIENSSVFTNLGRALFTSVAEHVEDEGLNEALLRVASEGREDHNELAELAAHFNTLALTGDTERRAAIRLLAEFANYVRLKERRR